MLYLGNFRTPSLGNVSFIVLHYVVNLAFPLGIVPSFLKLNCSLRLNQLLQMKATYAQTIAELNQELRLAKEEARNCRNDAELQEQKMLGVKKSMSNLKENTNMQVMSYSCVRVSTRHLHQYQWDNSNYTYILFVTSISVKPLSKTGNVE